MTGQRLLFGRPRKGGGPSRPLLVSAFPIPNCGSWWLNDAAYLRIVDRLPEHHNWYDISPSQFVPILDGPIAFDHDDKRMQLHLGIAHLGAERRFRLLSDRMAQSRPVLVSDHRDLDAALAAMNSRFKLQLVNTTFSPTTADYTLTRAHWHRAFRWHPESPAGMLEPTHDPDIAAVVVDDHGDWWRDGDGLPGS
jgi:hypothetical protein